MRSNNYKSYDSIVSYLSKHPCTRQDVATREGIGYRTATNRLKVLCERGEVRMVEKVEGIQIFEGERR